MKRQFFFLKCLQRVRKVRLKKSSCSKPYLEVGNWRVEENEGGDLILMNLETRKTVILVRKGG